MSNWPQIYDSPVTADTSVPTTTETVVATLSGISTYSSPRVRLNGFVQLTAGTGTTAATLRVRRGIDATGTLIGEGNPITAGVSAGQTSSLDIDVTDTPAGELAGASYVLTVQQTGASANGNAIQAYLKAEV